MRLTILKDRLALTLVLLALVIHFCLAFLPGLRFDMQYWIEWSHQLAQVGIPKFYYQVKDADYPPGYLYVLYALGWLSQTLNLSGQVQEIMFKLPGILAEVVLGILIYEILQKKSRKVACIALSYIIFNPALIFDSAVWGQVDSLLTLPMVLAVYLLIKQQTIHSSTSFAFSILIKPQALAIAPVFLLDFLSSHSLKKIFSLILPIIIVTFLLSFPFFPNHTFLSLVQRVVNTTEEYPYTSLSAYNLWQLAGNLQSDQTKLFGYSYYNWGLIFYLIFAFFIGYNYLKKHYSLFTISTLYLLGFYFLMTRIHERYLYPALIFLIIVLFQSHKRRLLAFLTITINCIFFIDLMLVYFKYNGLPNTGRFILLPVYDFLNLSDKLITVIGLVIFISLTYILLKSKDETIS